MNVHLEQCKNALDWGCAAVAWGALTGILPPMAAVVTIIYGVLRIRELQARRGRRHDDPKKDADE